MGAMKLEICIDSVESAIEAQKAGADRVELCAGLIEGGTTPSAGTIKAVRHHSTLGVMVIIRPRGGDFLYSDLEMEVMLEDIHTAKKLGANGAVIGCLRADGEIDLDQTRALMQAARPMSVTFHRAFDLCRDPMAALEQVIELGADRILTSGQEASCLEGADMLGALREKAGSRIVIMPGGGITPRNVKKIVALTGVSEIHMSCRRGVESGMKYRNSRVFMGGALYPPEYGRKIADEAGIRSVREVVG
jgi:copper homeostasis protein